MRNRFCILTKNWRRHGNFSGYERLIDDLIIKTKLINSFKIPFSITKYLKGKSNLVNYSTISLSKEIKLFSLFPINETIFTLYGDMDFYYLHYLKRGIIKLLKNKIVVTFHHPPLELNNRLNYNRKKILGAIDKIIVMGPNQIPFFKKYSRADIKFIPHGIDCDYFNINNKVKKKNQVLIIGVSHRDHSRNIKIINLINKKKLNIQFLVVMSEKNSNIYKNIKNVKLITKRIDDAELLDFYHNSKAVLLSLTDCTASNTILEALATGSPLIVNNVGAVLDYIPTSSEIPVFDKNEIEEEVDYLSKIINEEVFANKIAVRQRKLAMQYDWKVIAKITEEFINS